MSVLLQSGTLSINPSSFTTHSRVEFMPGSMTMNIQDGVDLKQAQARLKSMLSQITGLPVSGTMFFSVNRDLVASSGQLVVYLEQVPVCGQRIQEMLRALENYRQRFGHQIGTTSFNVAVRLELPR